MPDDPTRSRYLAHPEPVEGIRALGRKLPGDPLIPIPERAEGSKDNDA